MSRPADFAYRMEAAFTDVVPIGMVPDGLRVDAHYTGSVTAGPLAGGILRGVDYLLIRSDGVTVLDVRQTITTAAGHHIAVRACGYGSISSDTKPSAAPTLSSGARRVWPDAPSPLLGIAFCQTSDPEFSWLNSAMLAFSGSANLGTRKLEVTGRVLTSKMVLGTTSGT